MSGEMLDHHRPQNVSARQQGHAADPSEYVLPASADEMYLIVRALSRFARQKNIRWHQLVKKYGGNADTTYRDESARAYGIIERIHALSGGRWRYGRGKSGD